MSEHPWTRAARQALADGVPYAAAAVTVVFAVAIFPPFPLDGLLADVAAAAIAVQIGVLA